MHIQLIFTGYNCESYQFTCDNGRCISDSSRCDGYDDCGDYSEEDGCKWWEMGRNSLFYSLQSLDTRTEQMKSTKVQTLNAIPGRAVCQSEHALMKRVFEKAHALIKCTCNTGVRNIPRQKTKTITCNGIYIQKLLGKGWRLEPLKENSRSLSQIDSYSR